VPFFFSPWDAARRFVIRQFTRLLTKPLKNYTFRFPNDLATLKRHIRKGDIILVEGEQRVSEVVKYLTQSSWSHAAIYIGDELVRRHHPQLGQAQATFGDKVDYLLVEALVEGGVVVSPLSKYINFNIKQLGYPYDIKNVFDLARYFLPVSLVPRRFRRKVLHFGSGLPTQVICSSMLAAAFDKVGFPIVPQVASQNHDQVRRGSFLSTLLWFANDSRSRFIFRRSHPTLITPRDFDLSPYFEIVKFDVVEPSRFDYSKIVWAENEEEPAVRPVAGGDVPPGRLFD
jgi:Permuted papain-like amidase enzyme, YaeF/YiiX, C92 family